MPPGGVDFPLSKKVRKNSMLAKITSKNQITIPKKIMDQIPETRYFEVELRDGEVVLRPLRTYSTSLAAIRSKVKNLDLGPDCVREAIEWARSK
jgi:bifunctional DNA-binding transcriptional regulator/antitoxin component of YhaV-PrlF toxin-antitoxin module